MRLEGVQIALAALRANLLRSLPTMLGIMIAIAAVIAMIALGDGAQASVRSRIAKLGTTTLQIDATWVRMGGVEPQQDKDVQVQWGAKTASVKIVGATPNFVEVQHFEIDRGRVFTSGEDIGRQRVVVFGSGVLTLLGVNDPSSIIGEKVRRRLVRAGLE